MRLIYWYLRTLLFLGFTDYVYGLSDRWGSSAIPMPRRYNAAWEIQKDLLRHGFHQCPHCHWATRVQYEHIDKGEGYCYEQSTGNLSVPWDQEPNPQLAYEKMPDRLRHWPA